MKIHFTSYITTVLLALALGSCNIMDDSPCTDQSPQTVTPVQVGFTLTTGEVSSRAITEGEQVGTGRENYIDIPNKDFMFLLFSTEGKYLTTFEVDNITQLSEDNGQKYYVRGELSEAYPDFKLVVLANWGNAYPDVSTFTSETTIEKVCTATSAVYSYSSDFNIDTDLIPMFGVHTYNNVEWRADLLTDLPDEVDLLRAMAKIEVKCSAEGFKLSEVKLHRYNTKGYCAPTGVVDDTQNDWGYTDNEVCNHKVHIPANSVSQQELDFEPTEDGFIAYVPEFDNTTNVSERTYVEVSLVHADDNTPVTLDETNIYFCLYDETNGTPIEYTDFDIVRNHWYTYTIKNVDDGKLILCFEILVKPWDEKDIITIPPFE